MNLGRGPLAARLSAAIAAGMTAALMLNGCEAADPVVMPDVTGKRLSRALTVLEAEGIEVDPGWYERYGVLRVVSTDPAPGDDVGRDLVTFELEPVRVTSVIDGDTLDLTTGDRVRLIGLDAPERGDCGGTKATAFLMRMVSHEDVYVENPVEVENRDKYGRLLAYIGTDQINDVGYQLLIRGLAMPRFNSRDGYGSHPSEETYAEGADKATPVRCRPKPKPDPQPPPSLPPASTWSCSYSPTYNRDWHDDVLCTNGLQVQRPYLRAWDSFVTEDEIMESAREYEQQLNGS